MKIKVKGQVLKMITAGEWIDKVHEITDELERNADLVEVGRWSCIVNFLNRMNMEISVTPEMTMNVRTMLNVQQNMTFMGIELMKWQKTKD